MYDETCKTVIKFQQNARLFLVHVIQHLVIHAHHLKIVKRIHMDVLYVKIEPHPHQQNPHQVHQLQVQQKHAIEIQELMNVIVMVDVQMDLHVD